jgi:sterol desaturase/sphingolipid hydroxylase (fatty acid hydroxylase superfamily)
MTEQQFQLIRGAGFLAAAGLAAAAQRLKPHAGHPGSWRQNLGLWAVDAAIVGALCGACACTVARWAEGTGLGALNVLGAPAWLRIPVSVAALDLVSYVWHRANHRLAPLWRFHRVHHSDPSFTVSTGVRFHPGELVLSLPLRLAAVVAVGASPAAVVVFEITFTIANLIEHGDIDVAAPLEAAVAHVFVTPALHRRHHAKRDPDRNFGTIFSCWDRLLGTYAHSSSAVQVETGLAGLDRPITLLGVLGLPLR